MADCCWAPFDHVAAAVAVVELRRDCGHLDQEPALTCVEHLVKLVNSPRAERATPCRMCGLVAYLHVTKARAIEEEVKW